MYVVSLNFEHFIKNLVMWRLSHLFLLRSGKSVESRVVLHSFRFGSCWFELRAEPRYLQNLQNHALLEGSNDFVPIE